MVSAHAGVGGAAQQIPRVVIEPVQNFDIGAVGQMPVGEVRLPAGVGLGGLEADIGAARSFTWLAGDQPGLVQDAADRRCRGGLQAFVFQMPGNGDRAGVMALTGQLGAQSDHPVANLRCGGVRAAMRAP